MLHWGAAGACAIPTLGASSIASVSAIAIFILVQLRSIKWRKGWRRADFLAVGFGIQTVDARGDTSNCEIPLIVCHSRSDVNCACITYCRSIRWLKGNCRSCGCLTQVDLDVVRRLAVFQLDSSSDGFADSQCHFISSCIGTVTFSGELSKSIVLNEIAFG